MMDLTGHEVPELRIEFLGGSCPMQGWGAIAGFEFYFRARWQHWRFSVAPVGVDPTLDGVPPLLFEREETWGDGPYDAGYMPDDVAFELVVRLAKEFLAEGAT
jgi:hypothetical protein